MNTRPPIRIGQFDETTAAKMAKWRADVDAAAAKIASRWAPPPTPNFAVWVYIVRLHTYTPDGTRHNALKIGLSRDVAKRVSAFTNPQILATRGFFSRDEGLIVESHVQRVLAPFALPADLADKFIVHRGGRHELFESGPHEAAALAALSAV